ncbi:MAG: glycerophosphodiester phosphodiesterase [Pirellulales bacterium]
MLVIAHRGFHAEAPENTLAAFEAARRLGVDGIETDLRISADGATVLYHDRVAPDGRPICAVTRAELAQQAGYAVPTLDEALQQSAAGLWLLEVKTPDAAPAAVAAVRRYGATHRLVVISFWHTVVRQVASQVEGDYGVLMCHRPCDARALYPDWSRGVKTIVWHYEFLDAEVLAQARSAGLRSFVYGVETAAEHQQCVDWGLDGVITDHPPLLPRKA